jgi:hypothetical protein
LRHPWWGGLNRRRFARDPNFREGGADKSKTKNEFSAEVRERAIGLVIDH